MTVGRPKIPTYVKGHARAEWKRLAKLLESRRTLTAGDGVLLGIAAELTVRMIEARKKVEELGAVFVQTVLDSKGEQVEKHKKSPWLAIVQETERELTKILGLLSLVPLTRERVKPAASPVLEVIPGSAADILQWREREEMEETENGETGEHTGTE